MLWMLKTVACSDWINNSYRIRCEFDSRWKTNNRYLCPLKI